MNKTESRQLSIWSTLTESEKNKAHHKSRAGNRERIRAQRKVVTLNQQLIVKMRRDLRPNAEIANHLGIHVTTVVNFLRECFGDKDPLDLHVVDAYRNGETAKAIAKRLNISTSTICRILKSREIDPWNNYLNASSESVRRIGVPKASLRPGRNPDRPRMIAEDLYCFWIEVGNIEEVSIETGYSAASISGKFNSMIPGYKEQSLSRREESRINREEQQNRSLSVDFRTEKSFQDACAKRLDGFRVEMNVRGKSSIEIDLLVSNENGNHVLIECKIRSRKPDLCKAIGQSLINRSTHGGMAIPMICLPDDVRVYDSFIDEANELGVCVCHMMNLRDTVCKLLI